MLPCSKCQEEAQQALKTNGYCRSYQGNNLKCHIHEIVPLFKRPELSSSSGNHTDIYNSELFTKLK